MKSKNKSKPQEATSKSYQQRYNFLSADIKEHPIHYLTRTYSNIHTYYYAINCDDTSA
jgi:hypothetical protein